MTAEATDFYTGDAYAEKHPTWHDEYCAGKAGEIVKLLRRNNLHPRRIVDVGCGAGGVLQSNSGRTPSARFRWVFCGP